MSLSNLLQISKDPIFILLLYGFVAQLIFGVYYIFVLGVSRHSGASYKTIIAEYIILNAGIIAFGSVALTGQRNATVLLFGLFALLIAVMLHSVNM